MKDKAKEQEYKAEGLRRCHKRKETRLNNQIKFIVNIATMNMAVENVD